MISTVFNWFIAFYLLLLFCILTTFIFNALLSCLHSTSAKTTEAIWDHLSGHLPGSAEPAVTSESALTKRTLKLKVLHSEFLQYFF